MSCLHVCVCVCVSLHAAYTILTCCSCLHNTYMLLTINTYMPEEVGHIITGMALRQSHNTRPLQSSSTRWVSRSLFTYKQNYTYWCHQECVFAITWPTSSAYMLWSHITWHTILHAAYMCVCDCTCVLVDCRLSDMSKCMQLLCLQFNSMKNKHLLNNL